jgi:hypothetical protein
MHAEVLAFARAYTEVVACRRRHSVGMLERLQTGVRA